MHSRKEIKKAALRDLRSHYFLNVIVVFIAGIIINGGYTYASEWDRAIGETVLLNDNMKTNAEIIEDLINGQSVFDVDIPSDTAAHKYTRGYFSVFVNEITRSGSLGFGILNGVNKIIFHGKIGQSVTIFAMTVLSALIWIFF